MTQKSRTTLTTDIDANINDNLTGDISAADVRGLLKDLNDSNFNTLTDAPLSLSLGGTGSGNIFSAANSWSGQQSFNTAAPILGTMTLGSVMFAGVSGVVSQDNSKLFWDDANKRLGIGTASPSAKLHAMGTTEQLRIGYDVSNYYSTTVSSAGLVTFDATGNGFKFSDGIYADTGVNVAYTGSAAPVTGEVGFYGSSIQRRSVASDIGFATNQSGKFTWSSNALAASPDTGVARNAAGVVEINNGTAGTFRDLKLRELVATPTAVAIDDNIYYSDVSNANTVVKTTVADVLNQYSGSYQRTLAYSFFNDFINPISATSQGGDSLLALAISGGTVASQAADAGNHVGVIRSSTGAGTAGRAGASSAVNAIRLGGGTWSFEKLLNVAALSDGTNRYQLIVGFHANTGAATQTNGVFFLYDEGGVSTGSSASANWQCVTANNSARTYNTTATAVAAATWVKLGIEVNAAATSVDFKINGTVVQTTATNIPTAAGREVGFGWLIIKSLGTSARTLDSDYLSVVGNFSSNR